MTQPNLKQIMEQAKQMQKQMEVMQKQLGTIEVIGESGGGIVKITMTCRHEVKKLDISAETWKEDQEIISGLIIAAFNDAIRKVEKKILELTKGMGLPGIG